MSSGCAGYVALVVRDPITRGLRPDRIDAPTEPFWPPSTAPRRRPWSGLHRGLRVPWTTDGFPRERLLFLLGALLLAALSVALRLYHQTSAYELFVDEIEYGDTGNSFAAGLGPLQFGEPFFLHPSLPFWLLGETIGHPVPHMTVDFVLGLRSRMLAFGAVNCLLVIGVSRRVVGPWAALLAGLVYGLDPFVVRFDSRVMLEAPMMAAVLAGVLAALVAVDQASPRRRQAWLAVAGIAFGIAICTKTTSALITSAPLLLMAATSWGLRRREALTTFAVQCGCYVVYVVWIVASGYFAPWYEYTIAGTFRAVGVVTETGYNSGNSPSFVSRAIAQVRLFGPSYLLIGVAVCYACYLLLIGWRSLRVDGRRGTHALRGDGDDLGLLTCWLAGVLVALVYTFGLAEVEEQTFYLLAVPSTVVVAMLVTQMASWRQLARTVLTVVITLALTASASIWWTLHSQPDDAYRRLSAFLLSRLEPGTTIAAGDQITQFVVPDHQVEELTSVDGARRDAARYAVVSTELTRLGFGPAKQPVLDELAGRYRPVFVTHGRTAGDMIVYDLDRPLTGTPSGR